VISLASSYHFIHLLPEIKQGENEQLTHEKPRGKHSGKRKEEMSLRRFPLQYGLNYRG
jgi:hypothetical protein